MPYRRYKKRTYRRRKKKQSTTTQMGRMLSDAQVVSLRYCDRLTLDPAVLSSAFDTWTLSNCNDPYTAVGGHQPMGFDQWMNFYHHFTVLGAKATVTFSNPVNNSGTDCYGVIKLKASSAQAVGDIDGEIEARKSKYGLIKGIGGGRATLTEYYSPKKFFGLNDVMDLEGLKGGQAVNPTENAYLEVSVQPANDTINPGAINVLVVIDFIVKFTEIRNLLPS